MSPEVSFSANRWRPPALVTASFWLHAAVALAWALQPAWWPWLLAVLALNHAVLTVTGLLPRSNWLGPNLTRLPAQAVARREIALTIDDGPDPEVTPAVLDLLAQHQVRATFFCVGSKAQQYPDLCREIVLRGHAVENHSQHHRHHFSLMGLRGLGRELRQAQDTFTRITGQRPAFFRAPAGLRNPMLDPVLHTQGLHLASWTRRGFDTRTADTQVLLRRLTKDLSAGDILLLHDGNAARTPHGEPAILKVLPPLLAHISEAGLHPVTLRDALA